MELDLPNLSPCFSDDTNTEDHGFYFNVSDYLHVTSQTKNNGLAEYNQGAMVEQLIEFLYYTWYCVIMIICNSLL